MKPYTKLAISLSCVELSVDWKYLGEDCFLRVAPNFDLEFKWERKTIFYFSDRNYFELAQKIVNILPEEVVDNLCIRVQEIPKRVEEKEKKEG